MSVNLPNITNNPSQTASGASSRALASGTASASNIQKQAQAKAKNAQNQVNKIAQEQKAKADNIQESLQDSVDMAKSAAKTAIVNTLMSLITKFVNSDKVIDIVISNLIKKTKQKLNSKGRIEIKNKTTVIFYPKFPGDYSSYKKEFERKKTKLQKTVKTLKTIIDSVVVILKVLKTLLVGLQIQLQLKKKKLFAVATASGPDLSSPFPSKPIAAQYPVNKEINDQVFKELEDKINNYMLLVTYIQNILQILQQALTRIKIKVDRLSFNINIDVTTQLSTLSSELDNADSTIYNNGVRNYIIEVVTTPAGDLQAVAYDAFSKMKITQTAPSKTRKANELIEELKLILG